MSLENRQFGRYGGTVIADTNKKEGPWYVISFFAESVIISIDITAEDGTPFIEADMLPGKTFLAGYSIYGKITSLKLASGGAIAYNDQE